jgi:hypothetical protein
LDQPPYLGENALEFGFVDARHQRARQLTENGVLDVLDQRTTENSKVSKKRIEWV